MLVFKFNDSSGATRYIPFNLCWFYINGNNFHLHKIDGISWRFSLDSKPVQSLLDYMERYSDQLKGICDLGESLPEEY